MKKKKKWMTSVLVTVSILLGISFVLLIVGSNYLKSKDSEIKALTAEMTANKQILYVASTFIGQGEQIQDGVNVMQQEVYTGLEPHNYITQQDLGCVATIDIEENMPIMKNMTAPVAIDHDTREYEMRVVNMMADQKENDVVDVRIMFPTGEDFIVLSKKQVKNLSLEAAQFDANLSEEEILRMASATIDAYTITGTRIYTTRYVESNLQEASTPNYLVKQETIDLINSDPNVLSKAQETLNKFARLELEERIGKMSSEQLTAVSDGHGLTDTAGGQSLTDPGKTQDDKASANTGGTQTTQDAPADETKTTQDTDSKMMTTTKTTLGSQTPSEPAGETAGEAAEEVNAKEEGH